MMNTIIRFLETTRRYFQSTLEKDLEVKIADTPREHRGIKRLRKAVLDARIGRVGLAAIKTYRDELDHFCQHLIVTDKTNGEIIGTCSLLSSASANSLGYYLVESEFDLGGLRDLRTTVMEFGDCYVLPNDREEAVTRLLWRGLGDLLCTSPDRFIISRSSVSMADGGHYAASVYRKLEKRHLCAQDQRATPRHRLNFESLMSNCDPVIPPTIASFLKVGARLMAEPHRNSIHNSADFLMMLPSTLIKKSGSNVIDEPIKVHRFAEVLASSG
jgi:putative hemolysin